MSVKMCSQLPTISHLTVEVPAALVIMTTPDRDTQFVSNDESDEQRYILLTASTYGNSE